MTEKAQKGDSSFDPQKSRHLAATIYRLSKVVPYILSKDKPRVLDMKTLSALEGVRSEYEVKQKLQPYEYEMLGLNRSVSEEEARRELYNIPPEFEDVVSGKQSDMSDHEWKPSDGKTTDDLLDDFLNLIPSREDEEDTGYNVIGDDLWSDVHTNGESEVEEDEILYIGNTSLCNGKNKLYLQPSGIQNHAVISNSSSACSSRDEINDRTKPNRRLSCEQSQQDSTVLDSAHLPTTSHIRADKQSDTSDHEWKPPDGKTTDDLLDDFLNLIPPREDKEDTGNVIGDDLWSDVHTNGESEVEEDEILYIGNTSLSNSKNKSYLQPSSIQNHAAIFNSSRASSSRHKISDRTQPNQRLSCEQSQQESTALDSAHMPTTSQILATSKTDPHDTCKTPSQFQMSRESDENSSEMQLHSTIKSIHSFNNSNCTNESLDTNHAPTSVPDKDDRKSVDRPMYRSKKTNVPIESGATSVQNNAMEPNNFSPMTVNESGFQTMTHSCSGSGMTVCGQTFNRNEASTSLLTGTHSHVCQVNSFPVPEKKDNSKAEEVNNMYIGKTSLRNSCKGKEYVQSPVIQDKTATMLGNGNASHADDDDVHEPKQVVDPGQNQREQTSSSSTDVTHFPTTSHISMMSNSQKEVQSKITTANRRRSSRKRSMAPPRVTSKISKDCTALCKRLRCNNSSVSGTKKNICRSTFSDLAVGRQLHPHWKNPTKRGLCTPLPVVVLDRIEMQFQ